MPLIDTSTAETPVHRPNVTRFARGRLLLWMVFSLTASLLDSRLLGQLPRWVFAIWAVWITASALLVVVLEYVLLLRRRPWLDAVQACIDLPVIAVVTWHAGAGPYLLGPCLAIPMASAISWLPKRQAAVVVGVTHGVVLAMIALVASGLPIPTPPGAFDGATPPRAFLMMVLVLQGGVLAVISWLQLTAVRVARDRRDRWQRLFDSVPDAILVLDRDGRVVRMNAAASGSTSMMESTPAGAYPVPLASAADRQMAAERVRRALAGDSSRYEAQTRQPDGSVAHVLVSNSPLIENGQITGVLSIVHDLSEIRRAERERRQMEQSLDQHRRLLQSIVSTVSTYLYVLDVRQRRVTFANDALLEMLGYSLEALASMSRTDVLSLYHPDDVEAMRHTMRTFRRTSDPKLDITYRVRSHDGDWRWLNDRITVFERDADGEVTRLLGSAVDVTEQRRVSAQLRFSDELYRTLIENYPGGAVILFDGNANLLLAAGRGIREAGLDSSALIGMPVGHSLDAQTSAIVQRHCRSALEGVEQQFEIRLGDNIYDVRVVPVRDVDGTIRFGMALTVDVTERRRLEADVRQSQKMEAVGTLAGGVAHDFNNILASVIGYAELALLDADTDAMQADLQQVLTAAARGRQMVQRILTFSRRTGEELHPIELEPIVSETLRLLLPTLPAGVMIDLRAADRLPAVLGDAGQLHQVILNLCTNAIYAMRETGGTLTVRLERCGPAGEQYLRVEVRDTGTGMRPEVLERALDPFFTTKPPLEGTGMGLSMVHGIVTGMRGVFRLESVLHEGTTAIIELPADVGRPTPSAPLAITGAIPHGRERVMVVDDEPAVATYLSNALARHGYRTTTLNSAEAALEQLRDDIDGYDLVLTDVTMPGMSGEELLREARRLRPELPVVICTGYSASMTSERAYELGAAGYLSKPIGVSELAVQVRRILDGRSAAPPVLR